MKTLVAGFFLLVSGVVASIASSPPDFYVTVYGKVDFTSGYPSGGADVSHTHIQHTPVSNNSLYSEFGLLKQDYALVFSLTDQALEFIPRSASSGLSKVVAIKLGAGNPAIALESTTAIEEFQEDVSSTTDADGTYLKGTVGRLVGVAKIKKSTLANYLTSQITGVKGTIYSTGYSSSTVSDPPVTIHLVTGNFFTQGT
ncbi:MAG: hypothetical protein QM796_01245 [Chthoniobacteraceae bacterium]